MPAVKPLRVSGETQTASQTQTLTERPWNVVVWDDPIAGFWSTVVAFAPLPIYLVFGKGWRRSAARTGGG